MVLLRPKEAVHHHHRRIIPRTRRLGGLVEMVGKRNNFLRCSIISNSGSKDNFARVSESGRQSGRHPRRCGVAFDRRRSSPRCGSPSHVYFSSRTVFELKQPHSRDLTSTSPRSQEDLACGLLPPLRTKNHGHQPHKSGPDYSRVLVPINMGSSFSHEGNCADLIVDSY